MDQSIRNKLRGVVTQCRKLLEEAVSQVLQGQIGIYATGKKDEVHVEDEGRMKNLSDEDKGYRRDIQAHLRHIEALGYKAKDALAQLVREIAFTHLNRLCAYKMMEARAVWIGGKPFRESVSRGMKSQGFQFYLADHAEDKTLFDTGHQDVAYRHFLGWLGALLSEEIGVLFSPTDPANRLFPPQRVLDDVLALLNSGDLNDIWTIDETIGWVYQYFTPKELRDQVRKESAAPRNSYELAFRNQFFTPRYVVEFLTDNTLGRIWFEMRMGQTKLTESCRYLVRRPDKVFLAPSTCEGHEHFQGDCGAVAKLLLEGDEGTFPPFSAKDDDEIQRMISLSHCVSAYQRLGDDCWPIHERLQPTLTGGELESVSTQEILDFLFLTCRSDRHGGDGSVYKERWFVAAANEIRRRVLQAKQEDITQEQLLNCPDFVPYRAKNDPRELRILDPACGSGHFLLYCFDLLLTIYEEAYADLDLGPKLKEEYKTLDALKRDVPRLILAHNLHGIDIDLRASQIAALALWLRCQRAYREVGLKQDRPKITKSNFVCAEPMPGESEMLKEFVADLQPKVLGHLVEVVFDKMKLAGEAGSLLKIEEELREAIADVKKKWVAETEQATDRKGRPLLFSVADMDRLSTKARQPQLFDFSEISDEQFWNEAENQVLVALRSYAAHASNGGKLKKQLFAEDAERGFAFIDLFQKQFDVLLMNPPFGSSSKLAKPLVAKAYPRTKADLYAAFVERAVSLLSENGFCGCITSNSFLNLASLEQFREMALNDFSMKVVANLGYDVMDATVPAACTVFGKRRANDFDHVLFIEAKDVDNRETILLTLRHNGHSCVHVATKHTLSTLPQSIFAYWLSPKLRQALSNTNRLGDHAHCQFGLHSHGHDDQLFRTWWEISPSSKLNADWPVVKLGGDPLHFYRDSHYVIDWRNDGQAMRAIAKDAEGGALLGQKYYFRPGLAYLYVSRTTFSVHPLEECAIFSAAAHGCFPYTERDRLMLLGFLNSEPVRLFLKVINPDRFFQSNYVRLLPIPNLEQSRSGLEHASLDALRACRSHSQGDECSRLFVAEWCCDSEANSKSPFSAAKEALARSIQRLDDAKSAVDHASIVSYGLGMEDMEVLWRHVGASTARSLSDNVAIEEAYRPLAASHLSYLVGCSYGRWDIRFATGERPKPDLPDPFAALPRCSPGTVQGLDGLLSRVPPCDYPLRIDGEGIIPDDPDHTDDIVHRVREVLELIWKDRADSIEKEACEILGVKELRDYFRKPGKGGFWDDHVSRYSKSRRKAPIYWLLQSSKKNYGLWLYYHRLDKDMLFKARQNYVDPKIRLEQTRLDSLRSQKSALGADAKGAKKIDKDIERQETLLGELTDFSDKLVRAAKLNFGKQENLDSDVLYDPDLNDGVVLNIAPLWELVPWKEAKNYWEELLEGKYEWSSMSKRLWKKGLVK
jgi:hypothetical protein